MRASGSVLMGETTAVNFVAGFVEMTAGGGVTIAGMVAGAAFG